MGFARRLLRTRRHKPGEETITTVAAGWGRGLNNLLPVGYRQNDQPTPNGIELTNANVLTAGYGHAGALMLDGTSQWWGKNHLAELPLNLGPSGTLPWAGLWEYRTGLSGQLKLTGEGFTAEQILSKEQAKSVSIEGQAFYPKGCVCINLSEAHPGTWKALKDNVGVEPGTDPATWIPVPEAEEVRLFLNKKGKRYEPLWENTALPLPCSTIGSRAVQVEARGEHSAVVFNDGTIGTNGYIHFGAEGVGISKWWGKAPRPKLPRPPVTWGITGTVAEGSTIMEGITGVGKLEEHLTPPAKIRAEALLEKLFVGGKEVPLAEYFPAGTEIAVGYENKTKEAEAKIEFTQKALKAFNGKIVYRLIGREQPNWPGSFREHPGWPVLAALPTTAQAIATVSNEGGATWSLVLTTAGEVLAMGSNKYGGLGNLAPGSERNIEHFSVSPLFVKEAPGVNLKNIVAIAAGEYHCLALDSSHRVWAWGKLEEGQGGQKPVTEAIKTTASPQIVEGLPTKVGERPIAVAGTQHTTFVLLEDKTVMAFGGNPHGELGIGTVGGEPVPTPTRVPGLSNVVGISGGRRHVIAWTGSGQLFVWGGNSEGQIGDGTTSTKNTTDHDKGSPVQIYSSNVRSATASEYNTLVLFNGSTKPPMKLQIRFVATGEVFGEQEAHIKLRWRSVKATGWRVKSHPEEGIQAIAEIEDTKGELEEQIKGEGEFEGNSSLEKKEAEEELALFLKSLEERRAGATKTIEITPIELSPGVWEYTFVPPTPLTPGLNHEINLYNIAEGEGWGLKEGGTLLPWITTTRLWGSPYLFGAF